MSAPPSLPEHTHYEKACDQAIAMCDGNLRSTIKALIMANEYLEAELEELQAAITAGCVPALAPCSAAPRSGAPCPAPRWTGSPWCPFERGSAPARAGAPGCGAFASGDSSGAWPAERS